MPISNLSRHTNVNSWLTHELNQENKIQACCSNSHLVPESRGVYFWFMKSTVYELLSQFVPIEAVPDVFQKDIEGENYHLVYLGTAGTARNGNNTLRGRIKWHLCQEHNMSSICSGALSTLRSGLSALLLETSLGENSRDLLNDFLCSNFWIYWIAYEDINEVNTDERRLIDEIRPLLNIKNNMNARRSANDNPTKRYRLRRNEVLQRDRINLNCSINAESASVSEAFDNQIISSSYECTEYSVSSNQDLSIVTKGISNLPAGKCQIVSIRSAENEGLQFLGWKFPANTGRNTEASVKAQNVYSYFSNSHNGIKRSTRIHLWMSHNNIEEILVKVCADIDQHNTSTDLKSDRKVTRINNRENVTAVEKRKHEVLANLNIERLKDKERKKLLIIGCASKKVAGGGSLYRDYFAQNCNNDDYLALISDREERLAQLPQMLQPLHLPAAQRYSGAYYTPVLRDLYETKQRDSNLHILIVSGLYGLIDFKDDILNYQMRIDQPKLWGRPNNRTLLNCISAYITDNGIHDEDVYYSLSSVYRSSIKPIDQWKDCWVINGRSASLWTSARLLESILTMM